eukprot:1137150-Pelagomonas_calceolata.AAC.5
MVGTCCFCTQQAHSWVRASATGVAMHGYKKTQSAMGQAYLLTACYSPVEGGVDGLLHCGGPGVGGVVCGVDGALVRGHLCLTCLAGQGRDDQGRACQQCMNGMILGRACRQATGQVWKRCLRPAPFDVHVSQQKGLQQGRADQEQRQQQECLYLQPGWQIAADGTLDLLHSMLRGAHTHTHTTLLLIHGALQNKEASSSLVPVE